MIGQSQKIEFDDWLGYLFDYQFTNPIGNLPVEVLNMVLYHLDHLNGPNDFNIPTESKFKRSIIQCQYLVKTLHILIKSPDSTDIVSHQQKSLLTHQNYITKFITRFFYLSIESLEFRQHILGKQ